MPECVCGSHVTEDYVRVMTPDGVDQARTCPNCDGVRQQGEVRQMKSGHPDVNENPIATDGGER